MKIFLFRHGEFENPRNVVYGRLPGFHLSEEGREHVRKTAQKLKSANIKKIYSSPMERTTETAEIIKEILDTDDLVVDERLIESECDAWQGKSLKDFYRAVESADWDNQDIVEPIRDAGARIQQVLNEIIKKGENAVIVSHGDPLTGTLIDIFDDFDFYRKHYIEKGEFVELSYVNGEYKIEQYSDQ